MPGEIWTRSPEDWQGLVTGLLAIKYAIGKFLPIPDKVHGDCGLEGFTRDGQAFQCYAAEEPLTVNELTKKQKAKITQDIAKLVRYQAKLTKLLGPTVLTEWILFVPRWEDKELLEHAEQKLKELRTLGLSFISPTITPAICTLENLRIEHQQLIQSGKESLRIKVDLVDDDAVNDWVSENDQLVARLDKKTLAIRRKDQITAKHLRDETVRQYLDGQNALAKLRLDYPEIFETVDRIKKDKEHFLATESLTTSALPPEHWRQTRDALQSELGAALGNLSRFTLQQFVHEAVADWLIRCPLDFPDTPLNGNTSIEH